MLWLTLGLMSLDLRGDEPAAIFEKGNKLYEEGNYAGAVTAYDQLLAAGNASESVYFNRGNALFKLGRLGRAIDSYRLASWLYPRDPDVRANLRFVRARARGGSVDQAGLWRGLPLALTLNEWTCLTAGAIWLLFILLALGQWRPELSRRLRRPVIIGAVAAALLGTCLAVELTDRYLRQAAIVIVGEAEVRNGPLDESQAVYKVRDGVELEVLDQKDGWLQVADPAQRTGWIREDQVLLFEPPRSGQAKPPLVLH